MIELTREQQQAVGSGEKRVRDPRTDTTYVLVREDAYARLTALLADGDAQFAESAYRHAMEVFGRDGWDDPAMDVYDDLDPRRPA